MATVIETALSRPLTGGSSNTYTRTCFISNAADEEAAMVAMLNEGTIFPVTVDFDFSDGAGTRTYVRDRARVEPVEDANNPGSTNWMGTVDYVRFAKTPYQPGENVTSFEIGFQSVNIKNSKATSTSAKLGGGTPTNTNTLINVTPESCEGVDIDVPTFAWSETHILPNSSVTAAYMNAVYAIAHAPVSLYAFRGLDAYSVRFMGVQGSRRYKGGDWEMTFKFAASPNVTALTVGPLPAVAKKGWEYAWVSYEWTKDGTTNKGILKPSAIYVERVYDSSDFAGLGIGTAALLG